MNKLTKPTKISSVKRTWHLFDVQDKVLGRIATEIAHVLMGKYKPNYVKNLDCGDYVVVLNAAKVAVTGHKEKEKMYGNYSGYPGGLKQKALWQMRVENPTEIIKKAVYGMLPKNKLRDKLVTRLYIYPAQEHPYHDKFKKS